MKRAPSSSIAVVERRALEVRSKAEQMLAEAQTLPELREVESFLAAAEAWARTEASSLAAQNSIALLRLLARRRIAGLVEPLGRGAGGGDHSSTRGRVASDYAAALAAAGLTRQDFARMRLEATLTEAQIRAWAEEQTAAGEEVSQRAVRALVVKGRRDERRATLGERIAALPIGVFRVLYADPPWKYGDERATLDGYEASAAADQYPTASVEELCALVDPAGRPVRDLAARDAVLFCWATFPLLPDSLAVVAAWGFTYKTAIVWDKGRANLGNYHDARAELLLICTRGSCTPESPERPAQVQAVRHPVRHSAKPEKFRALIDRLYPRHGKRIDRIELFRRGAAPPGLAVWGNEAAQIQGAMAG